MIILGIDPGLADTGFGLIKKQGDNYEFVDFGIIKTSPAISLAERLHHIHKNMRRLISKHQPDLIAVEELFFAKNSKTAMAVAHSRGVILLTAKAAGCAVREFTPLQIKQALSGYGRAEKRQIQQMVKIILKLKTAPKPDDAADALAVAICAGQTKDFTQSL